MVRLCFYVNGDIMSNVSTYELEFKIECANESDDTAAAIIVAAGSSSRMGIPKQFIDLMGIPVLARTLKKFEYSSSISKIVLVVREDDVLRVQNLVKDYMIGKVTDIVVGGNSRAQSVKNGLSVLDSNDKYVLIHDGARPLVTEKIIKDVVLAVKKHTVAACAVKVKDTIKICDENGFAINTPKRDTLYAVQTPQGVVTSEYIKSLNSFENIDAFTDDLSVMEAAGFKPYLTEGDYKNIKITTPDDVVTAIGFLSGGEE